MTTGYQVGKECYSTSAQADDAYYSAHPVTITGASTSSNETVISSIIKSSINGWEVKFLTMDSKTGTGGGYYTGSSGLFTKNWPSCTLNDPITGFTDGALMGWGVVAAMALAWGVMAMKRAL